MFTICWNIPRSTKLLLLCDYWSINVHCGYIILLSHGDIISLLND